MVAPHGPGIATHPLKPVPPPLLVPPPLRPPKLTRPPVENRRPGDPDGPTEPKTALFVSSAFWRLKGRHTDSFDSPPEARAAPAWLARQSRGFLSGGRF